MVKFFHSLRDFELRFAICSEIWNDGLHAEKILLGICVGFWHLEGQTGLIEQQTEIQ
jgi:hypothetical protein